MNPIFPDKNASHAHSLKVLNGLENFDDFMDSISTIIDVGCGNGHDSYWWATRTIRDDSGNVIGTRPIDVTALDCDISKIDTAVSELGKIKFVESDFDNIPVEKPSYDIVWAHDVLQFSADPYTTLCEWNRVCHNGGMLLLSVPRTQRNFYNRYTAIQYDKVYHHYSLVNLIYLLALAGFDTIDDRYMQSVNDTHMWIASYKTDTPKPKNTSMHELAHLFSKQVNDLITKYGYISDEYLKGTWFNGSMQIIGKN